MSHKQKPTSTSSNSKTERRPARKQAISPFKGFNPLEGLTMDGIKERFRAVMQSTPDGIIITNNEQMIDSWNRGARMLFGYEDNEIFGKHITKIIPFEDGNDLKGTKNMPIVYLINGKAVELEGIKRDGMKVPLEVSVSTWETHKETFKVVVIRDITKQKNAIERLRKSIDGTIRALSTAVEIRDPYTAGHQRRVAQLACAMARKIGFSKDQIEGIRVASEIHDIGKISIPSEILAKPRKLSAVEFEMIKEHPTDGYNILSSIDFPWPIADIVLQHHERIDGSGYPNALSGNEILTEAKIIAIADTVEAMASHRPYREARGLTIALEELLKNSGISYDSELVEICLRLFKEEKFEFNDRKS